MQYVFITEDGREATSLEDLDGRTVEVANKYSKPKMSYAQVGNSWNQLLMEQTGCLLNKYWRGCWAQT